MSILKKVSTYAYSATSSTAAAVQIVAVSQPTESITHVCHLPIRDCPCLRLPKGDEKRCADHKDAPQELADGYVLI